MARRDTDLTSLATLAGLAYMLNKKDKKDTTSAPSSGPSVEKLSAAKQSLDSSMRGGPEEEAAPTGMGEATKFANAGTSSTTPVRAPRPAPMGAGGGRGGQGGPTAAQLAEATPATPAKAPLRYQSLADRARAYEEERAAAGAPGMYGTPSVRREPLPTASDMAYKKGGKVKKMASGGVTKVSSASRRADGIAAKGKTRGRIC